MDYYQPPVPEATAIVERRAPSGNDPLRNLVATPLLEPVARQSAEDWFHIGGTSLGIGSSRQGPTGPTTSVPEAPQELNVPSEGDDPLTALARRRIALIQARDAVARPSIEVVERLRILNDRIRQQSPRVTDAHVRALEQAVGAVEDVARRRAERMRRFGR